MIQVDLNLSTENDPESGKSLLHIAAASGALSIINVSLCLACIYSPVN